MKKFLAIMMCLIVIGTVQSKESKVIEQPKIEQECIDVGSVPQVQVMKFSYISDSGQTIYVNRFEKQFKQADSVFMSKICKAYYRIPDTGQTITNIYTVAKSDEQSDDSYILQKDVLCSQYRIIPDCPVEIIGKIKVKYITHYAYSFHNQYNQPPSFT